MKELSTVYESLKIVGIIAVLFLLISVVQAGDWPMFRHDARHTGCTNESIPDELGLIWSFQTGNYIESSPAVADGKIFVGTWDGKIYCLDENTGKLIWSYETGEVVHSSPAVANGKVFVGSGSTFGSDSEVYCLNADTGKLIWSYKAKGAVESSPVVMDGKVFVGSGGEVIYKKEEPLFYRYVGSRGNTICCLDENTGELVWGYETGQRISSSSPAVTDDKVFIGAHTKKIYALERDTGRIIWSYETGENILSSPAVAYGKVFVGSCDDKIYALDEHSGKVIWGYKTGSSMWSSPAVADGKVFVGSLDGKIYCLDENTGKLIWSYKTGGGVYSSPAIADDKIFVGSDDGKIYCLDENNGKLIWSYTTGGVVRSSPAVADGKVFVGSMDGKIYCFGGAKIGSISVSSDPSGAEVYLDEHYKGITPIILNVSFFSPSSYITELKKFGYEDYSKNVTVSEDKTTAVFAHLPFATWVLPSIVSITVLILVIIGIFAVKGAIKKKQYKQKINEYRAKIEEWKRDGYNVSELEEMMK